MRNFDQIVIDSLHNEVMTLRKQVKKLEKVIEKQKQEAQIVQAGIDFLEVQELNGELENEIESKRLDEEIREKFRKIREMRN
jgi:hypothetical protein